jgi:hypothetical protein
VPSSRSVFCRDGISLGYV